MSRIAIPAFRRCCVALSLAAGLAAPALAAAAPSLDLLLGGDGRARLQAELATLVFDDGQARSWREYADWGRELFLAGRVGQPPSGAGPSRPISAHYACVDCHNAEREDPVLPVLDPEARFDWIERAGAALFMPQGTTLWGAVNRRTFYAGDYARYHDLCVPKGGGWLSWVPCG